MFPTGYKLGCISLDFEDMGLEEHEEFESVGICFPHNELTMFNAAAPNVLAGKDAQFLARFCLQPSIHDHYISGSWLLALFSSIPALIPRQEIFVPFFEGMCTVVSPFLTRAPAEPFQFKHEPQIVFHCKKNPSLSFHLDCHPPPTHSSRGAGTPATIISAHSLLYRICLIRNCSSATAVLEKE